MSWSGCGSMILECPVCGVDRSARGLYWHLVIDHKFYRDAAYDQVGISIDEKRLEKSREKNRSFIDSFMH